MVAATLRGVDGGVTHALSMSTDRPFDRTCSIWGAVGRVPERGEGSMYMNQDAVSVDCVL
jgi:hypothetical protein